jgi:pimeloyl-ACP methyl ester carboxylesterase
MPEILANGLRFAVIDEGAGSPILLLHGFPDTAYLWRDQVRALVARGHRVIAPDLRGRGGTERPERVEAYAMGLLVADVVALLDALGVERAHVVGHDWGAALAWATAIRLPQRVDHLVTISVGHPGTGGRPTLEELEKGWYRLLFQFEGVAEALLQQDDWYLVRTLLAGTEDMERYIADLSQPGALAAALNWYRANLPPQRLLGGPGALPPVQAPTLGIFGAHDRYLSEEAMRRSGEFVTGPWRYERFAEAGHWIPREEPERLNALLLDFLPG